MTIRRMPWLPPAPDDFRQRCDAIDRISANRVGALRELANYELNDSQLSRLVRSLEKARVEEGDSPLQPFTLGIISNTTTDFLAPALQGSGLRHGFALQTAIAPFGVTLQAAVSADYGVLSAN